VPQRKDAAKSEKKSSKPDMGQKSAVTGQKSLEMHLSKIDLTSLQRARELFDSGSIDAFEVGTVHGLKQIHNYLFEGLYEFAGQVRELNISKNNFSFANFRFLPKVLPDIEKMPESSFDEIIEKYVEMNVAHPFLDGNGRIGRIWLDMMLKKNLGQCIDWQKITKRDYMSAMERSPINDLEIKTLLKSALTAEINSREVFLKGMERSYCYESNSYVDP
jgi:cell filamentation protein